VAGRPALMNRLEAAEAGIGAAVASKADFDRQVDRLLHDAEMVAAIGEAIQQPDFEYHDDDSYRGYSAGMRDAALRIRDACLKKNYEAARSAASELKKSCDACHGDYRS
jgi:cytochrome c556